MEIRRMQFSLFFFLVFTGGHCFGLKLKLLNFTFDNGSSILPSHGALSPPPMCPGNETVCSFDEIKDFSKLNATKARKTITRLLDILEGAAQATGLVRGRLFSSGGSDTEEPRRRIFLSRKRRQYAPFTSLCTEKVLPNEYPEIGRNENGEWRYLTGRQVVHASYCVNEGSSCSGEITLDSPREVTRCVQKFGFTPMVVFDQQTQKFANERIMVPCGCQCQYGRG